MREELPFDLRDWLRVQDLFTFGMSPQFLSRFDAMVVLNTLQAPQLIEIFLNRHDSAYHQTRQYFASHGIEFAISPAAVEHIAQAAAAQKASALAP